MIARERALEDSLCGRKRLSKAALERACGAWPGEQRSSEQSALFSRSITCARARARSFISQTISLSLSRSPPLSLCIQFSLFFLWPQAEIVVCDLLFFFLSLSNFSSSRLDEIRKSQKTAKQATSRLPLAAAP